MLQVRQAGGGAQARGGDRHQPQELRPLGLVHRRQDPAHAAQGEEGVAPAGLGADPAEHEGGGQGRGVHRRGPEGSSGRGPGHAEEDGQVPNAGGPAVVPEALAVPREGHAHLVQAVQGAEQRRSDGQDAVRDALQGRLPLLGRAGRHGDHLRPVRPGEEGGVGLQGKRVDLCV